MGRNLKVPFPSAPVNAANAFGLRRPCALATSRVAWAAAPDPPGIGTTTPGAGAVGCGRKAATTPGRVPWAAAGRPQPRRGGSHGLRPEDRNHPGGVRRPRACELDSLSPMAVNEARRAGQAVAGGVSLRRTAPKESSPDGTTHGTVPMPLSPIAGPVLSSALCRPVGPPSCGGGRSGGSVPINTIGTPPPATSCRPRGPGRAVGASAATRCECRGPRGAARQPRFAGVTRAAELFLLLGGLGEICVGLCCSGPRCACRTRPFGRLRTAPFEPEPARPTGSRPGPGTSWDEARRARQAVAGGVSLRRTAQKESSPDGTTRRAATGK